MTLTITPALKNSLSLVSLLVILLVSTGFVLTGESENNDKKKRKKIVKTAEKHIGTKYRAGGKSPRGFDCSGFSYYVLKENRIKIGASSRAQSLQGEPKKIRNLKPGDLIFFGSKKRISHVGIVTKQSRKELRMIHASSSRGIIEEDVYESKYWSSRLRFGRSMI